jgi:hypothetical protein
MNTLAAFSDSRDQQRRFRDAAGITICAAKKESCDMSKPCTMDDKYYEVVPAGSVAERLFIRARARIYRDFVALMRPAGVSTILDVGVSDVPAEGANLIERLYPHPQNITAAGLEGVMYFSVGILQ